MLGGSHSHQRQMSLSPTHNIPANYSQTPKHHTQFDAFSPQRKVPDVSPSRDKNPFKSQLGNSLPTIALNSYIDQLKGEILQSQKVFMEQMRGMKEDIERRHVRTVTEKHLLLPAKDYSMRFEADPLDILDNYVHTHNPSQNYYSHKQNNVRNRDRDHNNPNQSPNKGLRERAESSKGHPYRSQLIQQLHSFNHQPKSIALQEEEHVFNLDLATKPGPGGVIMSVQNKFVGVDEKIVLERESLGNNSPSYRTQDNFKKEKRQSIEAFKSEKILPSDSDDKESPITSKQASIDLEAKENAEKRKNKGKKDEKENSDSKDQNDNKSNKDNKDSKDTKDTKDSKDMKDNKDKKDHKDIKGNKGNNEGKRTKESKEDSQESKDESLSQVIDLQEIEEDIAAATERQEKEAEIETETEEAEKLEKLKKLKAVSGANEQAADRKDKIDEKEIKFNVMPQQINMIEKLEAELEEIDNPRDEEQAATRERKGDQSAKGENGKGEKTGKNNIKTVWLETIEPDNENMFDYMSSEFVDTKNIDTMEDLRDYKRANKTKLIMEANQPTEYQKRKNIGSVESVEEEPAPPTDLVNKEEREQYKRREIKRGTAAPGQEPADSKKLTQKGSLKDQKKPGSMKKRI